MKSTNGKPVESLPVEAKEGGIVDYRSRARDHEGNRFEAVEPKPTPSTLDPLEPWKDDPETPDDRVDASRLHLAFNGSNHDAAVRFSRDLVHARRMLLEACAISRRLSEEIVDLRKQHDALKPQPDSSSISTETSAEDVLFEAIDAWPETIDEHRMVILKAHSLLVKVAKGTSEPQPELAWLEARWKSALAEGMDDYSNALIVALEALKSYGGKG